MDTESGIHNSILPEIVFSEFSKEGKKNSEKSLVCSFRFAVIEFLCCVPLLQRLPSSSIIKISQMVTMKTYGIFH